MTPDGFHHASTILLSSGIRPLISTQVNVRMSLDRLGHAYVVRRILFDTGSNCQSIDQGCLLALTDPNAYPIGTVLPA